MRAILLSIPALLLASHLVLADNDQVPPTQDDSSGHKLIRPTSPGSSGNGVESTEGASSGEQGSLGGSEVPRTQSETNAGNPPINPYPNATNSAGQLSGGSVNGTGAISSAFPNH